ncbi:hypothetical protein, partial [Enterobacter cloacae complex sp. 4DZ3-17B2]|uniref:hypothetical protein n=1 Tax=Enterobacter cloacae complex sp. 4DZ3-17B2 TaxID=2511990 RepID=UPI001CA5A360
KCIKTRLVKFFSDHIILHKSQFGFREGLSTIDPIAILTKKVYTTLDNETPVIGVFICLARASDTLDHKIL